MNLNQFLVLLLALISCATKVDQQTLKKEVSENKVVPKKINSKIVTWNSKNPPMAFVPVELRGAKPSKDSIYFEQYDSLLNVKEIIVVGDKGISSASKVAGEVQDKFESCGKDEEIFLYQFKIKNPGIGSVILAFLNVSEVSVEELVFKQHRVMPKKLINHLNEKLSECHGSIDSLTKACLFYSSKDVEIISCECYAELRVRDVVFADVYADYSLYVRAERVLVINGKKFILYESGSGKSDSIRLRSLDGKTHITIQSPLIEMC